MIGKAIVITSYSIHYTKLYDGSSWKKAEAKGFVVKTVAEATKDADVVVILLPDENQADIYEIV